HHRARETRRRGETGRAAARTPLPRRRETRRSARAREPRRHYRRRRAARATADRRGGPLMPGIIQPIFGAAVILGIAYACSTNRRAINWKTVAWGIGLQVLFALIVLKTSVGQRAFTTLGAYITKLLGFAGVGAGFVFGPLGDAGVWGRVMTSALGPD